MKVKVDAGRAGAGASGKEEYGFVLELQNRDQIGDRFEAEYKGLFENKLGMYTASHLSTAYRTIHGASSRARQEANSPSYTQAGTCPNMRYAHLLRMPCICRTSSQRLRRLNDVQMFLLLQCRPGNGS